jgi:impB/mucB/samB family protein
MSISTAASVEQQLQPELRGKPMAVVAVETDSTCAIAVSYEAKAFGVKTGTPIYEAKRDPDGIELEIYCEVPEFDGRRNGMTRVPLDIESESADQPLTMAQARATKLKLPADL